MFYAEVSVDSPIAQRRTFSYEIPSDLNVDIGHAVRVPFGDKILQGVVFELTANPSVAETKKIESIIEPVPVLTPYQLSLSRWLSDYYLSSLFQAAALMLPPGFERRLITSIASSGISIHNPLLNQEQNDVMTFILKNDEVSLKVLENRFGRRQIQKTLPKLLNKDLIKKSYVLEKPKVKPKIVPYLSIGLSSNEAGEAIENLSKRSRKQAYLMRYLLDNPGPIALVEILSKTGVTSATTTALIKKGWLQVQKVQVDRDPLPPVNIKLAFPLSLTTSQSSALEAIRDSIARGNHGFSGRKAFLLIGVTGSGKTEVYLQALAEAVRQGKRGIVLVPEIAMTPQIIERFVSRFPGRVAILHSELSLGEQFDEWWRIKKGDFDVVIGPRSAIFAPQPDLGLIIIDEEHEWTYKQHDHSPRYHARDAALKLSELTGATVVLGSATPDIVSYYKALSGEYHLLELPERVTPSEGAPLPRVEVVDLRRELKKGNLSVFSHSLYTTMDTAFHNRQQVLLFLNRRGSASFVECRNCGMVMRCKRCDIALSYHLAEEMLVCHQCNYHIKPPLVCPRCRSRKIKYLGLGTEKLEQETAKAFPHARLLRWDSDITRGHSHSHQQIYSRFKTGAADVLVGTQMIAKGLDLPGVTVVGVVNADISLNLPDFRAGERTFQLLSQVAGRAGRGIAEGNVILQTYSPENYVIQSAARQNYLEFYRKEISYRNELRYPPFSRLVKLVFSHTNELHCQEEANRMKRLLIQGINSKGLSGINLIGPAPAFISRVRGHFRWQIIIRGQNPTIFLSQVPFPRGWTVDVDPLGLT